VTVQDHLLYAAERASEIVEGFKIEVVGGHIIMTPQSDVRSWTVLDVQIAAREAGVDKGRLLSDVKIDFPGEPPRYPDVTILDKGASTPYSYEDVLAAVEVVSDKDDPNDYTTKLRQYAHFGIPMYVIIDPFRAQCQVLTLPKDSVYAARVVYDYGETVTLELADGETVRIPTDEFKRKS
jgi:Uma2 family endonuclease